MQHKFTFIDLFAGAGGLSEGFIRNDFEPIAHVESDLAACFTLKTRTSYHKLKELGKIGIYENYLRGKISREELYACVPDLELKRVIHSEISAENNPEIFDQIDNLKQDRQVDIIIGGPPCQAYSLPGRARDKNNMKNDARNYLYIEYAKFLERYKPRFFVFENVLGLRSAENGAYYSDMKNLFKQLGYHVRAYLINAFNFKVPQRRKRIIILGALHGNESTMPDLESCQEHNSETISAIFHDLPLIVAGGGIDKNEKYKKVPIPKFLMDAKIRGEEDTILTQHIARPHTEQDKKIYEMVVSQWEKDNTRVNYDDLPNELKTHKNKHSFTDRFKVVSGDLNYSHTVVAHICKDGHHYIHPDKFQNRSISVREAARLQTFPDNFFFEGVIEGKFRTAAFKQIGNAVPPMMADIISKQIKGMLHE